MFFLIENGFAEEYANIQVLDWQLWHKRAGVVEHGGRGEQFDLSIFFGGHLGDLFFYLFDAIGEVGQLIIDEFLDVLGVTLDADHDIPAPLLNLCNIEHPVIVHEMLLFNIERLKKHIGLIFDVIVDQKFLELGTDMRVEQVATLNPDPVGLSQKLWVLQEEKELYRYVDGVFRL